MNAPASSDGGIRLAWATRDSMRGFTVAALLGGVVFVALGIFGLPKADLHSPLHYAGLMDPLCGMTRAMRSLAAGDLTLAWRYNPGSYVIAFLGAAFTARWVVGVATGRWLTITLPSRRATLLMVWLVTVALWVNQQLHADLLMTRSWS